MSLAQKYKPRSWAEVVGQDQALTVLDRCRQSGGLGGHAFWLAAGSGRGKPNRSDNRPSRSVSTRKLARSALEPAQAGFARRSGFGRCYHKDYRNWRGTSHDKAHTRTVAYIA